MPSSIMLSTISVLLIKAMSQDRGKDISADYLTAGDAMALLRKESSLLQRLGDYVADKGRISPIIRALSDARING